MPKTVPIQDDFSAGEISNRYLAQVNHEAYKNGVGHLTNFIPRAQGPVQRRAGNEFIGEMDGSFGRCFGFPVTSDYATMAVISDEGALRILTPDGWVIQGNLVQNGSFLDGSTNWTDTSNNSGYVIFTTGACEMVPGTIHPTINRDAGIQQAVAITTPANTHEYEVDTAVGSDLCEMNVRIGTAVGLADLVDVTVPSTQHNASGTFVPGVSTVYIEVIALSNDDADKRIVRTVIIDDPAAVTIVEFTTPWAAEDLATIQIAMPPGENTMYFVHRLHPPQELVFDIATDTWTFNAITFTSAPAAWVTGNYPGAIAFFQGRMWLGGTNDEPESFWGSKSGLYTDFTTGSNPADALSFVMANKGIIQWLVGAKNLLIGTEYGEYIVTSESGVIQPGDIQVDQQSAYGSAFIQPIQIGNRVLYVSPDRRKVRDMGYKWTDDGWVSRDITFISEHITDGNEIVDFIFAQNPDNLLLCVCRSGNIVGATYERGNDKVGWFRAESDGVCTAVCSVNLRGKSVVGVLHNRDIQATPTLYAELCVEDIHLDSYATTPHDSITVSGLTITVPHLADKTVGVIIDGSVHPTVDLDGSGVGTLQWTGEVITVGLPFTSTLLTLPLTSTLQVGQSTMPMMKRYNKVFTRIYDSAYPLINGYRASTRHPSTPMNTREPDTTEDVQITNLGWDRYSRLEIAQDLPIACNIAGIFGEAAQELIGQ